MIIETTIIIHYIFVTVRENFKKADDSSDEVVNYTVRCFSKYFIVAITVQNFRYNRVPIQSSNLWVFVVVSDSSFHPNNKSNNKDVYHVKYHDFNKHHQEVGIYSSETHNNRNTVSPKGLFFFHFYIDNQ